MAAGVEIVELGAEHEFGPIVDSDVVFLLPVPGDAAPLVSVVQERDGERLRATVEGKADRAVAELTANDPFRPGHSE